MSEPGVDMVLFDLGGVLLDLNGLAAMRRLSGIKNDEEIWRRWLSCEWVRRFERGHCSAEDFAHGVVYDWALDVDPEGFLEDFTTWPREPFDGAEELLREVGTRVRLACLSNTNMVHWEHHFSRWPLVRLLDHRFLSFELGMVKPDREVFEHVAAALEMAPSRILFLDDNTINVDAASRAGFQAARVRGIADARQQLVDCGVVIA